MPMASLSSAGFPNLGAAAHFVLGKTVSPSDNLRYKVSKEKEGGNPKFVASSSLLSSWQWKRGPTEDLAAEPTALG